MARNKKRTRPIIINAPKYYNPGKGRPREELAYISDKEKKRLLGSTDHKSEKTKYGILSFADDSASSMGVSRGDPSQGTIGSSGGGGSSNRGNESGGVGAQSGSSKAGSSGSASAGASKSSGAAGAGGGPGDQGTGGQGDKASGAGKGTEAGGVGAQSGGSGRPSSSGSLLGGTKSVGTTGRDDRAPSIGTSSNPNNPVGAVRSPASNPRMSTLDSPNVNTQMSTDDRRRLATQMAEGTYKRSYDTVYGDTLSGRRPYAATPDMKPSEMTVGEVKAYQNKMKSELGIGTFPMGAFQMQETTIQDFQDRHPELGITDDTPFDAATQNILEKAIDAEQGKAAWQGYTHNPSKATRDAANAGYDSAETERQANIQADMDAWEGTNFGAPPGLPQRSPTATGMQGLNLSLNAAPRAAPTQAFSGAGESPFADNTTFGLEEEQPNRVFSPSSRIPGSAAGLASAPRIGQTYESPGYPEQQKPQIGGVDPLRAGFERMYNPLGSVRVPQQAPDYDPLSSMIGRRPNTAAARPAYNPLGSIQAPRKAYDPLSSVAAPRPYDPLSSIQAPKRAYDPLSSMAPRKPDYDPLSSVDVPEQTPGWSPPGTANPARSFAEPQLQARMRNAVNQMTEVQAPSIADMALPGEAPYRSLMDPTSGEMPDDMMGNVVAEEPIDAPLDPIGLPAAAYQKRVGVTPQQLAALGQSPVPQDAPRKSQARVDEGAPVDISPQPEYTPDVAPAPAEPPNIARKNIPQDLQTPEPADAPVDINPPEVQQAEVRQRTSVNQQTDVNDQAQQAIMDRYGDMGEDLVRTVNMVKAAMGGGRSNMARLMQTQGPPLRRPPPPTYDEEIPLLEA